MVALRKQGYTYGAIADELYAAGLTDTTVSIVRVQTMLRRVAPDLLGNIRRKLMLPHLIGREPGPDIVE